jgi:hypothetical protein
MTDAELTLRVTRWCERMPSEPPTWKPGDTLQYARSKLGFWGLGFTGIEQVEWCPIYHFAEDLNAWPAVHALLEERNIAEKYEDALISVIEEHNAGEDVSDEERHGISLFDGATAPPRARCKALVRMAGGPDTQAHRPCVGGEIWDGNDLLTCGRCDGDGCG